MWRIPHAHVARGLSALVVVCAACGDPNAEASADGGAGGDVGDADVPDAAVVAWTQAFDAAGEGALLSVWGPDDTHVYAVGGQPDAGVAWRYDGAAWARVDLPPGPLINWVHGAGGTLFMVGNGGRALRRVGDGAFEALTTGETQALWGVFAVAPDDVWAVGGEAAGETPPDPVIVHFDGATWTRVALPPADRAYRAFFKVWASGPRDVWAIGQAGVVMHFDGAAFSQVLVGTDQDLISLWGNGPDRVAVVGGRSHGVLARFDGTAWRTDVLTSAAGGVPAPGLNGVFMDAAGGLTAVGDRGHVLRIVGAEPTYVRESTPTRVLLHGVFETPGGHRVAVGGTLLDSPPWEGVALEVRPTAAHP